MSIWNSAAALVQPAQHEQTTLPLAVGALGQSPTNTAGEEQDWGAAADQAHKEDGCVAVWTDGSVLDPQTEERKGGYAAAILKHTVLPAKSAEPAAIAMGRYEGPHCHSDMMEALAVVHALFALPISCSATVYTDSMVCVQRWAYYVEDAPPWEAARRRSAMTLL
jgi:hypothetical protein